MSKEYTAAVEIVDDDGVSSYAIMEATAKSEAKAKAIVIQAALTQWNGQKVGLKAISRLKGDVPVNPTVTPYIPLCEEVHVIAPAKRTYKECKDRLKVEEGKKKTIVRRAVKPSAQGKGKGKNMVPTKIKAKPKKKQAKAKVWQAMSTPLPSDLMKQIAKDKSFTEYK